MARQQIVTVGEGGNLGDDFDVMLPRPRGQVGDFGFLQDSAVGRVVMDRVLRLASRATGAFTARGE